MIAAAVAASAKRSRIFTLSRALFILSVLLLRALEAAQTRTARSRVHCHFVCCRLDGFALCEPEALAHRCSVFIVVLTVVVVKEIRILVVVVCVS